MILYTRTTDCHPCPFTFSARFIYMLLNLSTNNEIFELNRFFFLHLYIKRYLSFVKNREKQIRIFDGLLG